MSACAIGSVFTARDRRSRGKVPASASKSSFHHTKRIAGERLIVVPPGADYRTFAALDPDLNVVPFFGR